MQLLKLVIVAIGLLFIFQAEAKADALVAGSGCSARNVEVLLTQNQTHLAVGLDGFVVESGRTLGRRLDRKSCQVVMPVEVPAGYQVAVAGVNYKGYSQIPAGGMARIEIESFLNEADALHTDKIFTNQFDDNYVSTVNAKYEDLRWSACGEKAEIKVKTTMLVQSNNRMDSASAVMNGADPNAKMNFNLSWRKCDSKS